MVGGQAHFGSWWAVVIVGWLWWAFLVAGSLSWVVGDHLWMVRVVIRGHYHRHLKVSSPCYETLGPLLKKVARSYSPVRSK